MDAFYVAADAIVALHVVFVVFVALGGLLAFRWRWVKWVHLPAVAWGVLIECAGGVCPLTPLENVLRQRAGSRTYSGDFIEHYVLPALYPPDLTHAGQIALGSFALALNALIYWRVFRKRTGPVSV
jgi:hypothetical protein